MVAVTEVRVVVSRADGTRESFELHPNEALFFEGTRPLSPIRGLVRTHGLTLESTGETVSTLSVVHIDRLAPGKSEWEDRLTLEELVKVCTCGHTRTHHAIAAPYPCKWGSCECGAFIRAMATTTNEQHPNRKDDAEW